MTWVIKQTKAENGDTSWYPDKHRSRSSEQIGHTKTHSKRGKDKKTLQPPIYLIAASTSLTHYPTWTAEGPRPCAMLILYRQRPSRSRLVRPLEDLGLGGGMAYAEGIHRVRDCCTQNAVGSYKDCSRSPLDCTWSYHCSWQKEVYRQRVDAGCYPEWPGTWIQSRCVEFQQRQVRKQEHMVREALDRQIKIYPSN